MYKYYGIVIYFKTQLISVYLQLFEEKQKWIKGILNYEGRPIKTIQ